jgi:hypothetical protein
MAEKPGFGQDGLLARREKYREAANRLLWVKSGH